MNPISAQNWIAMSSLIDDAMELPLSERDEWLQRLTIERPEMATAVRAFLQAQAQLEAHDLLERGPHLRNVAELGDEVSDTFQEGDGIGPYSLLQPLGRGGMAVVWLAERTDASPARRVALKVPQLSVWRFDFAARFARERDILASLEHPNIARLYDAGLSTMDGPGNGRPYLAMEYVEGQGLTKYCDEHTLDIPARIQLFMQVLDAVQYAHARLVIHRDLKPSNILVADEGQVRLLDFGVAKLLEADRAAEPAPALEAAIATRAAFTPEYASPEQVRGAVLGTASDVYSLGVVLYELLCGQRPYRLRHATSAQLELAILDAESDAPSSRIDANGASRYGSTERKIRRQLRGDLDTIVAKTLKKQPVRRSVHH